MRIEPFTDLGKRIIEMFDRLFGTVLSPSRPHVGEADNFIYSGRREYYGFWVFHRSM